MMVVKDGRKAATEPSLPSVQAVSLSSLHPAPWNPRTIKDDRFKNLCASIHADPDFLWRRPILAQANGTIYAGNMRFRAAQHLGFETIPAIVEEVPDQLARERALRDNAQWGDWQQDEVGQLIAQLEQEGSALNLLGFDERELQRILDRLEKPLALTDPEDIPDLPEEPLSKPGDLYQLGEHRLLCGDATNLEDVVRLLAGEKAACLWTDPPYGVEYVGGTRKALTIQNDHPDGLDALLEKSFKAIDPVLNEGAAIYIAHPAGALSVTFGRRFLEQGWRLHESLVWVKDSLVPGHSDYHYRHEPVLFGYKAADGRRGRGSHGWYGGNDASSVFEVPRPKASPDHPTSKPVALIEAMIKNSSRTDDVVLDAFLGGGSTLIAAERLGRRCFGLDIDPRYVDVSVRRWEQYTGLKAVKVE